MLRTLLSGLLLVFALQMGLAQAPASATLVEEGRALHRAGDHAGALALARQATDAATTDAERGHAHMLLADAHNALGQLIEATAAAMEAHDLFRQAADTRGLVSALDLLSVISFRSDKFADAERYVREQIAACRALDDAALLTKARVNLANIHYMKQEWDSAAVIYRSLIDDPQASERTRFGALTNLGSLLSELERHTEAIAVLRRATEAAHAVDINDAAWAYNNLGYGLHQAGRHGEAIEAFRESDRLNQLGRQATDLAIENAGFMAEAFAAMGRHKEAYETLMRAEELKDAHHRAVADERLLELEKRFETKLKEEQIARLDLENIEKAERLRLRNTQLFGSLALLLLAAALSVLFWRNFRNKRRHADVLDRLNRELRDQKGEIEHINALLRLKVLRTQMNPHFIYNCLHAIDKLVTEGRNDEAHRYTHRFARLLRMVLDHSVKDVVGLDEEREFLEHYLAMEGLRLGADFTWAVYVDPALLDADAGIPALLVQPFVENAVWHGLAAKEGDKRIEVRFVPEGDAGVRCTISDNGVGRASAGAAYAHRHGHKSMALALNQERVELIRHRLGRESFLHTEDLVDAEGRPAGTEVRVLLPLEMEQV
jgi:tetratricopeptide (TPR) repeat protein